MSIEITNFKLDKHKSRIQDVFTRYGQDSDVDNKDKEILGIT